MGWLELLPLLRRVLPLLDRLTPMLESVLAGRAGARAETDRTTAAVAEITSSHQGLAGVLETHGAQLAALTDEVRSLRAADAALQNRAAAIEAKLTGLAATVRNAAIVLGLLLCVCLVLLVVLLQRHG